MAQLTPTQVRTDPINKPGAVARRIRTGPRRLDFGRRKASLTSSSAVTVSRATQMMSGKPNASGRPGCGPTGSPIVRETTQTEIRPRVPAAPPR